MRRSRSTAWWRWARSIPTASCATTGARDGDVLVLTKGLGVGILSAALKQDRLSAESYRVMLASTTQLNGIGAELADMAGVHACTDVTGFGLLGHTLELCRGSGLRGRIRMHDVPVLAGAGELAQAGFGTGAATRNWQSYGGDVTLAPAAPDWQRGLLCDPQTSGGLLIAVDPAHVRALLVRLREDGFAAASAIGVLHAAAPGIDVA